MASTYKATLVGGGLEFGAQVTNCPIKTGKTLLTIEDGSSDLYGIVSGSSSSGNWYIKNDNSDLAGVKVLGTPNGVTAVNFEASVTLDSDEDQTIAIEEFSTALGQFDNKYSNNESVNFSFRAYWTRTGGSFDPILAQIICDIYHDYSDVESVLIGTITQDITSTSTKYSVGFSHYTEWYVNSRYTVKWKARFIGGPGA